MKCWAQPAAASLRARPGRYTRLWALCDRVEKHRKYGEKNLRAYHAKNVAEKFQAALGVSSLWYKSNVALKTYINCQPVWAAPTRKTTNRHIEILNFMKSRWLDLKKKTPNVNLWARAHFQVFNRSDTAYTYSINFSNSRGFSFFQVESAPTLGVGKRRDDREWETEARNELLNKTQKWCVKKCYKVTWLIHETYATRNLCAKKIETVTPNCRSTGGRTGGG